MITSHRLHTGDFSVLTLTRRSAEILMDKKTITIRLPKKKPKSETVTKIGRDEVTTFDKELFDGSELCGASLRHRRKSACIYHSYRRFTA